MDVDGFTTHTFTTLAHGFDLNEIVAIGGEGQLHIGFVGKESGDITVMVPLHQHLRQERNKYTDKKDVILDSKDKLELNWDLPNTQ